MAYDSHLAERIRELLNAQANVTEKKMFGGLAFLINGNMAVSASSQGGIIVRVNPDDAESLIESPSANFVVMRGRQMRGWLRIETDKLHTKQALSRWVHLGVDYASQLPTKAHG